MANWLQFEDITFEDVPRFVEMACGVLKTIDEIDFGMIENGKNLKKDMTNACIRIINTGLNTINEITKGGD